MPLSPQDCCVLNGGNGAWAFAPLAERLAACLGIDISDQPRRYNYLLHLEPEDRPVDFAVFIPTASIRLASDKRLLAAVFQEHGVPTPETRLCDTFAEVLTFTRENADKEWCLKFPTSCGANGHRLLANTPEEPANWPRPFVVQEFIRLEHPEVYRTYGAGGELFGWAARRFPAGSKQTSEWVAHARGARYAILHGPPPEVREPATRALQSTGLWPSFGCVDLLQRPNGEWLVLEVGTDGLVNHVDRDLGDPALEHEIEQRIATAFWEHGKKLP